MAMQTPEGTRGQTVLNDPEQHGGRQTNRLGFIAIERGSGERTGHVVSRSHSDININNGEGGEHHKGLRGGNKLSATRTYHQGAFCSGRRSYTMNSMWRGGATLWRPVHSSLHSPSYDSTLLGVV